MTQRRRRSAALGAPLGILLILGRAGSCRDIVAGENLDVTDHLCTRVQQCFANDGLAICKRIQGGSFTGSWEDSLDDFERRECEGGNCGVIRSCLSIEAFCIDPSRVGGADCLMDFECCEADDGLAACENGSCCQQPGAVCNPDTAGVCRGNQRCEFNGTKNTCGGVVCAFVGAACDSDGDCCTGICGDAKTCEKIECLQAGDACLDGCCPGLECRGSICRGPIECVGTGEVCDLTEPCCSNEGDQCVVGPNGLSTCENCGQEGFDCAQDGDCCSGECLPIGGSLRCAGTGCIAPGTDEAVCEVSSDCCEGDCFEGACIAPPCTKACTDPCVASDSGLQLASSCDSTVGSEQNIEAVIAFDPFCDCTWDAVCISEFVDAGGSCP